MNVGPTCALSLPTLDLAAAESVRVLYRLQPGETSFTASAVAHITAGQGSPQMTMAFLDSKQVVITGLATNSAPDLSLSSDVPPGAVVLQVALDSDVHASARFERFCAVAF